MSAPSSIGASCCRFVLRCLVPVYVESTSVNAASGVSGGTFWFTLALVNAGSAEGKQRSRLAWFLLSLLLGPIAAFLVVVPAPAPPRI